jgi:tetratricopeptide (TPR) repeat protein
MYFLAEAYKNQGNKQKAIELFEKCKSIVNNPDFSKEIDQYISTFK